MSVNYSRLVSLYEQKDAPEANSLLREAFASGDVRASHIDLGRLFVECFGWSEYAACRNKDQLMHDVLSRALTEAEGAVNTSAFLNITGQIVYSTVLDAYQSEDFVFSKLIPEQPTVFLQGEKIAGVTRIGNEVAVRNEGDPYALAGVGEDWIFTPPIQDRGFIVPVTWEAVFSDRTGQLMERIRETAYWSGYEKEIRAIDCVIDENVTKHRYNWRGTTIATYGDNSGTHTWDNLAAQNGLVDWTNINSAEVVFNAITDPYTGAPTLWEPKHLIVTKQLEQTARRVISATEIRVASPGYATTGNPTQTIAANPFHNKYELVTSRLLAQRLAVDTDWFLADVSKMAKCMVAQKMQTMQAPSGAPEEFHRQIVAQFRVNERCEYVVTQPRAAVKSTVS